ncbi:hypothetical protein KY317_01410 [Candidatus Woesearchaeota archaeon]|nr:hypothetical protein [Candidatus Woesearchaeota archaeon]
MFRWLKEFRSLWYEDIIRRRKVTPFIIFVCFLIAFIGIRGIVYYFPNAHIILPYHFHHFFVGILFVIASNWIALVGKGKKLMWTAAGLFGLGIGLIADEIGVIVICGTAGTICDPDKLYWARFNYDIVIFCIVIFLLVLYFKPFWLVFRRRILGIVYKPWRVYSGVEKRVKKEIEKGRKAIEKKIKKRI